MRPAVTRIDPRAARYLQLLVEFGHLDERSAEEVLHAASEAYLGTPHPVGLTAIQRFAAARVVRAETPMEKGPDILSADWPLLFL